MNGNYVSAPESYHEAKLTAQARAIEFGESVYLEPIGGEDDDYEEINPA